MQAALLLQMLASRQRGAGNTQITELLARMNGAAAPDGQSAQDMLSQLATTNPMLAALMQQMNAGSAGSGGQRRSTPASPAPTQQFAPSAPPRSGPGCCW